MLLPLLLSILVGYLLGSVPVGYLVARSKGVNIFEVGSKNPGATNVRRVLGAGPGNLVFVLDALKGAVATALPMAYFWHQHGVVQPIATGDEQQVLTIVNWQTASAIAGLLAALIGHSCSCFTRFRGGKGVATSVGGLLILMPLAVVFAVVSWFAVFCWSRYVSLASICAALVLVLAAYLLSVPSLLLGLAFVIAGFVVLRHRTNIARLINGTENKFVKKSAVPKS